jgi:addiction module RelB/DinJ family antitoxin
MKTMLNIKIDEKLKQKAQKTAEAMGIPLGTVANILLRQFVKEKEINISISNRPSAYLRDAIRQTEAYLRDAKAKGNLPKPMNSKELFEDLGI